MRAEKRHRNTISIATRVPPCQATSLLLCGWSVCSQTDLVHARRDSGEGAPLYHHELDDTARSFSFHLEELDKTRVEQIMTPGAIALDEETPVEKVAKVMIESRIHRVLITKADKLSGIVTSMDLLRALIAFAKKRTPARPRAQVR